MVKAALCFTCILIAIFSRCQAATTKAPSLCAKCLPRQVTLTPATATPGSVTPVIKMLASTPQGCRRMNVVCKTPAGYVRSNLVLNGTGPTRSGKDATVLLTCFKGSWRTTHMGSFIYVNSVKCGASK